MANLGKEKSKKRKNNYRDNLSQKSLRKADDRGNVIRLARRTTTNLEFQA